MTVSKLAYGVAWNDSYKLGNEQVDSQHRQLFELLSRLISSCMDGSDIAKLKDTLDFLVNYAVQHFADEEALQLSCDYPDYERHKQLHEDFKVTVGELVHKFTEHGSSTELNSDVNKIIVRWLVNHIHREDKKIGEHMRSIAADGAKN